MNAAITQGHKQTELGIVPEDWHIQSLPEALQFLSGKAHEQFINEAGPYVVVNSKFISTEGKVRKYTSENFCPAKRGDVLMVMSDLPNGRALAKCYLVKEDKRYAVNQRVCIFRPKKGSSEYFYYLLNRNEYFMQFDDGVQQTHLLNPMILSCPLKIPSESEQYRIGQALTDIDALISCLDQLIAKKRDIQQATMQQLLTGQRRLPGFSGEWEMTRLGDVADLKQGYAFKSEWYTEFGSFKVATIANVQDGWMETNDCSRISSLPKDIQPHHILSVGEIIISMTGNVGRTCKVSEDGWLLNQRVGKIIPIKINPGYLFFLLSQSSFSKAMMNLAKGGAQGNLSSSDITEFVFWLPASANEQIAIFTILSDMEAELAALEARRDKARQLKQGMMQELLTGRIRLV